MTRQSAWLTMDAPLEKPAPKKRTPKKNVVEDEKTSPEVQNAMARASAFEPRRANRWILSIDGIDAFCVKSIVLPHAQPEIAPIAVRHKGPVKMTYTDLHVEIHDVENLDTAKNVMEMLHHGVQCVANLRYLDSVGKITDQITMVVHPKSMTRSVLDYASRDTAMISVVFAVSEMTFGI